MPHFTLQIAPNGPLLDAYINVSQARATALQVAHQTIPGAQKIRALLDTGASHTCVDPSVLVALGIPPHGTVPILTPSTGNTPHDADVYDVSILIPAATPPPHVLPTVAVAGCHLLQAQGYHALIGRDILQHWVVHYNGPAGILTVSY